MIKRDFIGHFSCKWKFQGNNYAIIGVCRGMSATTIPLATVPLLLVVSGTLSGFPKAWELCPRSFQLEYVKILADPSLVLFFGDELQLFVTEIARPGVVGLFSVASALYWVFIASRGGVSRCVL